MSKPPYRIIFMGSPEFAVPGLLALLQKPHDYHVVAVVTQPPKPAGRGRKLLACAVQQTAESQQLTVLHPFKIKTTEFYETLQALQPDVIVVAAYGRILPPNILALPRYGCINVHASLLPKHRGASPIAHSILHGDTHTGISLMHMDAGLDTGPVYCQEVEEITAHETCASLTNKLAHLGANLLLLHLPAILAGTLKAVDQAHGNASHAPLLQKNAGWLNFRLSATELERQIRAFCPWPGSYITYQDKRIAVLQATVTQIGHNHPVGYVIEASQRGLLVACEQDVLWIQQVKPPGRNAMPAAAWVAGRGITTGTQL